MTSSSPPDAQMLEETVGIGYATVKKKGLYIIGRAVGSVGSDRLEKQRSPNLTTALQERFPGLDITRSGSMPGSSGTIKVRGVTTMGDTLFDSCLRQPTEPTAPVRSFFLYGGVADDYSLLPASVPSGWESEVAVPFRSTGGLWFVAGDKLPLFQCQGEHRRNIGGRRYRSLQNILLVLSGYHRTYYGLVGLVGDVPDSVVPCAVAAAGQNIARHYKEDGGRCFAHHVYK